jgi:succinoglycan biosynthesis transport protein ExoP
MESAALNRIAETQTFHLRQYLHSLWKFKWILLLVFLVVSVSISYSTMTEPKVYAATTTIEIDTRTPQVHADVREVVELGTGGYWSTKEFYATQYEVIRSRTVAQRVVEREGLDRDPDFLGLTQIREPERLARATREADAAGLLMSRVSVDPVGQSQLARVRVEDPRPERAVRLSIAVARAYRDINLERKIRESTRALQTLKAQLEELGKALEASENKLVEFKREYGILTVSLADRQNVVTQDLLAFAAALAKSEAELVELRAKLEQARQPDPARRAVELQRLEAEDKVLGLLLETRAKLRQERSDLLAQYLERHPKVLALERKSDWIEKAIRARRKAAERQVEQRLKAEVNLLKRQVAVADRSFQGYKRLVQRANAQAQKFSQREKDYLQLQRVVEQNRQIHALVSKRYKEVELAREVQNNNVSILDEARQATLVRPRLLYSVVFAAGLGGLASLAMLFLLNLLDKTIKNQEDIEQVLGLTFLGVIPSVRDESGQKVKNPDLYVHEYPQSTMAELCRSVRTNILFMAPDRKLKTLLVTSAAPLEGKTTVALSLGISMAQAGGRVALVSSDMRRPRIHEPFGLNNGKGISNWIVGEAELDEILQPTSVPNLSLLTCGPLPPNPAEILQAEKFHSLVEELESRFDRILFDSPPVGAVTDPLILGASVDGVILVVRAGSTTKDMVRHSFKKLQAVNAQVLGCVVNHLDLNKKSYGYYYYRHQPYYAAEGERPPCQRG